MIDKDALYKELLDAFIQYQYRLEHPFPNALDTDGDMRLKYLSDPVFCTKVRSMVSGVMQIIERHANG